MFCLLVCFFLSFFLLSLFPFFLSQKKYPPFFNFRKSLFLRKKMEEVVTAFQFLDFIGRDSFLLGPLFNPPAQPVQSHLSLMQIWMTREMKLVYFKPKHADICSPPFQTSQECLRSWYLLDEILFVFFKYKRKHYHISTQANGTRCKTFSSLNIPFINTASSFKGISCLRKSEVWKYVK